MSGPDSICTDGPTPPWSRWTVAPWPSGWTVLHVDETGSTNDDLLTAALAGAVAPRTALVTAHQTAGRGRLDRRWDAPPSSNLLVTLYPGDTSPGPAESGPAESGPSGSLSPVRMMQLVGVAAVDGLQALVGTPVEGLGLKWPNDVMLDGRKLAGVLAQARTGPDGLVVVVGFGLNVGWAPEGAASVHTDVTGLEGADRAEILAAVLRAYDIVAADSEPGADDRVGAAYRSRLVTLGQRVRIELPGDRVCIGNANAVLDDGRLEVVDDGGATHVFGVGDVVHLRPTSGPPAGG